MKKFLILMLACILSVSCVHNTDINAVDENGFPIWVTEIPVNSKRYYGIGSAKLVNDQNSLSAAETKASADVAKKLEKTMKQASTVYSNEAAGVVVDAFEEITIQTVNITMRGIVKEQQWKAPDGTWWVLVSFPIKNVDRTFELEANNYQNKLKEKALAIEREKVASLNELDALKKKYNDIEGQIAVMKADKENDTTEMVKALRGQQEDLADALQQMLVANNATSVDGLIESINRRCAKDVDKLNESIDAIKPAEFASSIADEFKKAGYVLRDAE